MVYLRVCFCASVCVIFENKKHFLMLEMKMRLLNLFEGFWR